MATSGGYYSKFYSKFTTSRRNGMIKTTCGVLLCGNILKVFNNPDAVAENVPTARNRKINEAETGMDRMKLMFSKDEFGELSPEFQMVTQSVMMGFFAGSIIGGTIQSRENYLKFMERNQASTFYSHWDAKRRLQDKVTVGFFRGAWMWGWRLSLFTGSITFFTTAISVYRGKSSILEYLTGGALAGTIYKFKHGPKPMVAGCVIGGVLGTIAGSVSLALMYLTGTSMEEIRYWQYKWKEEYQESKLEKLRELRQKDMNPLIKSHEEITTNELLITHDDGTTSQNPPQQSSIPKSISEQNATT